MFTSLGSLTLGQCVPVALVASAELAASVNLILPEISAKLTGLLQLQASLAITPPSLSGNLQAMIDLTASLQASIALGLPGIDFQVAAVAALLLEIQALLGTLNTKLALAISLQATLGAPGVFAYQYVGAVGSLGGEAQATFSAGLPGGSPADNCAAWVFVASDGGAIDAAGAVFAAA